MKKFIIIIGTMDTKGKESKYLSERIKEIGSGHGIITTIIDVGILGEEQGIKADFSREDVAIKGGNSLEELRCSGRSNALKKMSKGAVEIVKELYQEGKCDGIVCLAGGSGSSIAGEVMEVLPVGIPKLIATPLASGPRLFEFYIKNKDIMVMHSVVDIIGVNSISKIIFDNVAGSIVGQVINRKEHKKSNKVIAITLNGNTTDGGMSVINKLESSGYEVVVFHANGVGGRAMEEMLKENFFNGVIDYTTIEIFEDIIGGIQRGAGEKRMTVAGKLGLAQVIVPGCVDFFDQGPIETIPEKFKNRKLYAHSPAFTLCRLTREEMSGVGKIFAEKLNTAKGRTVVVIPLRGFSIPDSPGGPFEDKEADMTFVDNLEKNLHKNIPVKKLDLHINDKAFGEYVANLFIDIDLKNNNIN